jgi:hypothetical protein
MIDKNDEALSEVRGYAVHGKEAGSNRCSLKSKAKCMNKEDKSYVLTILIGITLAFLIIFIIIMCDSCSPKIWHNDYAKINWLRAGRL